MNITSSHFVQPLFLTLNRQGEDRFIVDRVQFNRFLHTSFCDLSHILITKVTVLTQYLVLSIEDLMIID